MGLPLRSALARYGLSPRTMHMPELGYIALMIFKFAGGRPIPVSASWVTSPVARPMSILPSARSGAFSVLPLVLRCSTASVASISFRTAEYAAPYTWKPPPGVAVPSTTTVFCCAAAWFKPPLMIATASAKIAGATGVRSPPSPVCLFMFVVSHLPQRVDSRAALLYHAPTLQRPGAEWRKFSRGSVRTRAGGLDYAAPLQRLVPHELLQVLRRASDRPRALRDERGAQLRRGDCLHERHVQLVEDFARRSGRRDHGMPGRTEHAREPDFRRRRDIGQERRAQGRGDDERLQAPGFDVRQERGDGIESDLHLARHHLGERLRDALVGHVHDLDAGDALEEFADEMQARAHARRAEIQLAWMRSGIGQKLDHGIRRQHRAREEHERQDRDERHRLEVLGDVVAELLVEARPDRERPDVTPQERVAVGRRLGDRFAAYRPTGAAAVVHQDLLPERRRPRLADEARGRVHRFARGEGHDEADRLGGISLRERFYRDQQQRETRKPGNHGTPSVIGSITAARGSAFARACRLVRAARCRGMRYRSTFAP